MHMHSHTALHAANFMLDTFLRQLLRALLEHVQKRVIFLENMVGKCLFKTVCVDKYFFIVSCLQSPSFVATHISAFYTADKRACRARFSTPQHFGLVV